MSKKSLAWTTIWLLTLAANIWLGFERQWSVRAWIRVGLVLLCGAFAWFFSWLQAKFDRDIAALPPDERERRLAAMTPPQREHVLRWMKDHEPNKITGANDGQR